VKRFGQFIDLIEADISDKPSRRVVFAFMRCNPPTKGHEKVVNTVLLLADNDDHYIIPSQTKDKKRDPSKVQNPLEWNEKIGFMKELFPHANILQEESVKSPFHALEWLHEQGYTDVVIVAGSDRVQEYQSRMPKYADELFKSFRVESAGVRDPDASDTAGMSGTKAREAALEGKQGKFNMATGWEGPISRMLMAAVRKGMGVE